jgi:MFS family permease
MLSKKNGNSTNKNPIIFTLLCILSFLIIFGGGIVGPMLPLFALDLGASITEIGLIRSSYFAARIFIEIPIGIIGEKVGRRRLMTIAPFVSGISALICGTATNSLQIILGRIIWGIGISMYMASSTVFIINLFGEEKGKALGLFQGIGFLGQIIAGPIGGVLSEHLGFRSGFYFTSLVMFSGFILMILLKDIEKNKRKLKFKNSKKSISFQKPFATRSFVYLSIISFIRSLYEIGITQTLIPIFQVEQLGFTPLDIGFLAAFRTVGLVTMTLVGGYLSDRVGCKMVLIGGIIALTSANIGYIILSTFFGHSIIEIFNGIGMGALNVTLPILIVAEIDESIKGVAIGTYRTVFTSGKFIGPIIATIIYHFTGSIQPVLNIYTYIIMVGLSLTLILRKNQEKNDD